MTSYNLTRFGRLIVRFPLLFWIVIGPACLLYLLQAQKRLFLELLDEVKYSYQMLFDRRHRR